MDYETAIRKARYLSDLELHMLVSSKVPMVEEHIAAKLEIERRDRNRSFWCQALVARLALCLSVISLVVAGLYKIAT